MSQQEYIDGEYKVLQGDVITPQQRISELEQEINSLKGGVNTGALANIIENPSALRGLFSVNEAQTQNIKALITGVGTGTSVKYLSKYVGDELAAVMGAFASAYVAKKIFGSSR